jgi:hypothetical protein
LYLIAQCGLYQHNIKDWEQKPLANQMWINLHPFNQEAFQQCLTSGTITLTQSGYAQSNRFVGLATKILTATQQMQLQENSICSWRISLRKQRPG